MKDLLSKLFIGIILYIYLYNPIFKWPGVSLMLLVYPIALIYALGNMGMLRRYLKYYRPLLIISVITFAYVFCRIIIYGGEEVQTVTQLLMWLSMTAVLVPFFLVEFVLRKSNLTSFWDTILNVGFVASLITIACVVNPYIKDFVTNVQVEIEVNSLEYLRRFRNYGLASGLTNTYGYVQGTLASICLLLMGNKRAVKYYLFFLVLAISAAVNARTGLFPIMITGTFIVFKSIFRSSSGTNIITTSIWVVIAIVFFSQLASSFFDQANFVYQFFNQLDDIYDGNKDTAYITMWILPNETNGLVFGEGRSLFGKGAILGYYSDIGYVNQIFIGGLIFAGLLLIYELVLYMHLWKMTNKKFLPVLMFASALIFNYKGLAFYATSGFNRLVMLYYFTILYNYMASRKLKSRTKL